MNISWKRGVALAAAVVGSGLALAQVSEIWSGDTRITQLYPSVAGMNFITVYSNTSLSTCDNGSRWVIPVGVANYDATVAALMAAFYSGKQVNLNITVSSPVCAGVVNRFIVKE